MKAWNAIGVAVVFGITTSTHGQGFVNLNFEAATVPPTVVGGFGTNPVNPSLAFPGWTVGAGGSLSPNFTLYNNLTLGSVAQVLVGPNYPNGIGYTPLEGSYSALLQFGPSATLGTPALIQTGFVPSDARSITFLVSALRNDARVLLDGTEISLVPIGNGRVAGDVSAFAGRQAELTFSTHSYSGNWLYFDDVTFSPAPVPEPSIVGIALLALAYTTLFARRGRMNRITCVGPVQDSTACRAEDRASACAP